ncbi:hypothetical protein Tco_0397319 [Tanacetum coccineum]
MDSIQVSEQSSVSQNSISFDVVDESSGMSDTALIEEIVAYEHDSDETQAAKKLDALRTPQSFVTLYNFDTPGGTVYYIPKVYVDVLLVKGTLYDSIDGCIIVYMKYVAKAGFIVRKSSQQHEVPKRFEDQEQVVVQQVVLVQEKVVVQEKEDLVQNEKDLVQEEEEDLF